MSYIYFYKQMEKYIFHRFDVISIGATKEEQLRKLLKKMKKEWETITLSTSPYKYDDFYIIVTTVYLMIFFYSFIISNYYD